jgi:electron transfer flavoprotein alpha subunit
MQGAEKIVAVNADPRAPIFRVADVGLVGDYQRVVPLLIRELRMRLGHGRTV